MKDKIDNEGKRRLTDFFYLLWKIDKRIKSTHDKEKTSNKRRKKVA